MIPLPDLVPGAQAPCFMVPDLRAPLCGGCMFLNRDATTDEEHCLQEKAEWRHDINSCGANNAIFIPATREAFDAHQLKLIAARLTT